MIDEKFTIEDVVIMRKSMINDGWKESIFLPAEWLYKNKSHGVKYFPRMEMYLIPF